MKFNIFGDHVLMHVGPVPITETMLISTIVSLAILAVAIVARVLVERRPDYALATMAVVTVQWLDGLTREIVGKDHPLVATLSGSLFLFIASANVAGQLPGVHAATASLATSSALAVVVFLAVPIAGIWKHGFWGYLKHYLQPNPLLMPLHVISELSRTLALSVRLFGNMMSGHLIIAILVALTGFLVPTPVMALELMVGLLQAYIFAVLAAVYIGAALGADEED